MGKYKGCGDHNLRFSAETEEYIGVVFGEMRDRGFYLSEQHLLGLVNGMREKLHPENKKPITTSWLAKFYKRNPGIKARKASSMDHQRTGAASEEVIRDYNTLKLAFYARLRSEGKISGEFPDPSQILNMDEIAADVMATWGKVIVSTNDEDLSDEDEKVIKASRQLVGTPGDTKAFHVTSALTTDAAGGQFPPFIIQAGNPNLEDHMQVVREDHLKWLGEINAAVTVTTSGSMKKSIFIKYATHLIKCCDERRGTGTDKDKTYVLFLDGHASRWDVPALRLLKDNNIEVFCLPSHSSVWSQPNDCGVNKRLKKWLKEAFENYLRMNIHSLAMTRDEYNRIFVDAWKSFLTQEAAELKATASNVTTRAFKKTGISPHNAKPELWTEAARTIGSANVRGSDPVEVVGRRRDGTLLSVKSAVREFVNDFVVEPVRAQREENARRATAASRSGPRRLSAPVTRIGLDVTAENSMKELEEREKERIDEAAEKVARSVAYQARLVENKKRKAEEAVEVEVRKRARAEEKRGKEEKKMEEIESKIVLLAGLFGANSTDADAKRALLEKKLSAAKIKSLKASVEKLGEGTTVNNLPLVVCCDLIGRAGRVLA